KRKSTRPTQSLLRKVHRVHKEVKKQRRAAALLILRVEPVGEAFADEGVIVQLRIAGVDAGNFFALAEAEGFVRVETPDSFEKALAAQDFVKTGNAAGEMIGGVEEGGVGIGDFETFLEKLRRDT